MISKELQIGRAGEFLVLADLLLNQKQAFLTDQGVNYDVVFENKNKLIRLQVKTTQGLRKIYNQQKNQIYFFHLKRCGKNGARFYKKKDFDGFALVILDLRKVCYLPFNDKVPQNSISIRDREVKYIGKASCGKFNGLYYQDLTLENFLNEI